MVEAGFTRAKNASNIIMKNLMDFAIGSLVFFVIGFAIMFGQDINGFIGSTGFFNPTAFEESLGLNIPIEVFILCQTVFAATAATIVSGAMAERTKFISYVIYSAVISIMIYPIVGHWIWGGGWLSQLGFIDFAGSTVVHSLGGWAALVGGLVAITAGCAAVSMWGAIAIGIVAGFVIVFGVEFVDKTLKVDDPVGAIGVHATEAYADFVMKI